MKKAPKQKQEQQKQNHHPKDYVVSCRSPDKMEVFGVVIALIVIAKANSQAQSPPGQYRTLVDCHLTAIKNK